MENLLFSLLPKAPRSVWTRYGVTAALIGLSTLLRYSLDPILKNYPFLLYIPAIFFVSLLFDRASGFIAVILSCILSALLFIEPRGVLWISNHGDQLAFLIYLGLGLGIAAITEALRKTLDQLHQSWEKVAAAEREKDLMLMEVNHRIRNDLQLISAQLILAAKCSESASDILNGINHRIGILSRVYGRLRRLDGAGIVSSGDFLESLVEDLQAGMVGVRPIGLRAKVEHVDLETGKAVAIGIIANELVTNAVKYAFPDQSSGWVNLSFHREDDEYVLCVADNGVGLGADQPKGAGLGSRIMHQLALQLRGKLTIGPRTGGGVEASLHIPASEISHTR